MSGLPTTSFPTGPWSLAGASTGPTPIGGGPTGLPTVTNPNLPSYSTLGGANLPPPVPQPPSTPFSAVRTATGPSNSMISNNYATANTLPSTNPILTNAVPNLRQDANNAGNNRRLTQLEEENMQRRDTTANLAQLGTELVYGQMEVQEQVLQYQYMLEECMDKLENQNYVLNEQEEQLGELRTKIRHLEYLIDAFKYSEEGSTLFHNLAQSASIDENQFYCCGDPISLPPPSTSPFYAGGPTRATASTFQPFNPRYRSPNSRAATAASLNARRSVTPTRATRGNLSSTITRPSRRGGYYNN